MDNNEFQSFTKKYIEELISDVSHLTSENQDLNKRLDEQLEILNGITARHDDDMAKMKKALRIMYYNMDHLEDSDNKPVSYQIDEDDNDFMEDFLE